MLRPYEYICKNGMLPFENWKLEIGHRPPLEHFDNLFDLNKPAHKFKEIVAKSELLFREMPALTKHHLH